jgi:hypothetical protein
MPRVVPSQVVSFIDSIMSRQATEIVRMNSVGAGGLLAVLDLVDQVPDELLTMDKEAYGSILRAKGTIREILGTWTSNQNAGHRLLDFSLHRSNNPLAHIRDAFAKCADESPAPVTSELKFITDADLRTNLRNDIGAVTRALSNGEWKAATVLAGSAIEALLLWDLQNRRQATYPPAVTALVANRTFQQQPSADLEEWTLHHYVEVEAHLGIIQPETATETRLAKRFRNLIHPGRAQRLGQTCDRGTALASVAALDHVVRDLS